MNRTILLTGGSGLLGRELLRISPGILAPPRSELDVSMGALIEAAFEKYRPEVVIHAAAATLSDAHGVTAATRIQANILGTSHIALSCLERGARLVYLSTDYVYPDTPGPHREDEPVQPYNDYGWSKLGGECAARLVPDSLIIRTSFGPRPAEYSTAASDKLTSRVYVDEVAPRILELALSRERGIINVGAESRSMFEYVRETRPDVRSVNLADLPWRIPRDSSLDLARWKGFKSGK